MRTPLTAPVYELADGWRSVTRASRRRAVLAILAAAVLGALLGARHGTALARGVAVALVAGGVVFVVLWERTERRRLADPASIVRRLVSAVDAAHAARALRALSLVEGAPALAGTSPALAEAHVARSIALLPRREVLDRASKRAVYLGRIAALVLVLCCGFALANAWSVLEGADVLCAVHGTAPFAMTWLEADEIVARPPDYLHETEIHAPDAGPLVVPYGTVITVRGTSIHPGRSLRLSDGTTEQVFADDGAEGVVARWKVTATAKLRVVARFGDVVVPQASALSIVSVADEPPAVRVDGAPREIKLVEAKEDIAVRFHATDDHGLREVQLVLRSGTREDRRILAHLDGETRDFDGGAVVKIRDPFLTKSHAPVTLVVEAKDNDPLLGPKWGASEAITIVPPDVGEPEARRLDALRRVRDSLVDSLASRLSDAASIAGDRAQARRAADDSASRAAEDEGVLADALGSSYGGMRVPARLRAMLVGQEQATRKAVDTESRAPSVATHAAAVHATERFVLVTDAVVRGLGAKDTRTAAKDLADVADDLAEGARQLQSEAKDERARGGQRMDAAYAVLLASGKVLLRLGDIGADIGEIVGADLLRVSRARSGNDPIHAELAARDLATRLRQPDPSFESRGGRGRGGVESGGGEATPGEQAEAPDDVEQAFEEAAQDLERLAQDHAGEIAKMDKAMRDAASEDDDASLRDEAKRHAQAVREAARHLPAVGMGSDSWTSKGSAARELAEQMAHSLEEGRTRDAAESGRSAAGNLDEAKRMLQQGGWFEDPTGERQREVENARRKLESEARWAEEQSEAAKKRAADRARDQLAQGGKDEQRLAERAAELSRKGRESGSFPEKAIDSIDEAGRAAREAARSLQQGDADRGLERQREAQRALEAASDELHGDRDEPSGGPPGHQGDQGTFSPDDPVAIPKADEHKGPEGFRRRVTRGLAEPASPRLRDAVRRYAEGLLR